MAELEPEEFQRWSDIYYKASTSLENREKNVDDAAELIEKVGRLSIAVITVKPVIICSFSCWEDTRTRLKGQYFVQRNTEWRCHLVCMSNRREPFPVLDTLVFLLLMGTYPTLSSYIVCFCLHYRICSCWELLLSRTSCRRLVSIFPCDVTSCWFPCLLKLLVGEGLVNTLVVERAGKRA